MDVNRFRPFEEDMTGRYSKGQTGRQAGRQADKTDRQVGRPGGAAVMRSVLWVTKVVVSGVMTWFGQGVLLYIFCFGKVLWCFGSMF